MDVVVRTSVLSCLNSGLYTASRMIFSLAGRGDAPKSLSRIEKTGVPMRAVLVSTIVGFLTVGMNYLSPDKVFLFLVNSSGAIALFVWLVISVSQLRTRRKLEASGQELELKMWFFPYLTYATIAAIIALCIGMLTLDSTRSQMIVSLGLAAILVGIGLYRYRNHKDTDADAEVVPVAESAPTP